MRNKFILWLSLLIAFSVTFHSCRTDLEATGKHNEEKLGEHIHQKISTGTFQKETFLSGVNEFKRSNNSLSGKSSSGSDYLKRFFIDETSIYKMDVNNTQTYALRAYNIFESPETVYNLVYRKKDNDVAFSIVKILDNELIPVYDSQKGIVTKIDNPSTARICTDFYSVEIWHCKEGVSWSQCDKCAQCLFTSSGYTSYECGGGGGGSTGGGGSFPGGGDTGGGGGGTGLYDPSGYTFDPNIPPSIEPSYVRAARASSFFYSQTDQAKSWAVEHADIYCNILEYYLDHIPPTSPPPNSYYQDFANFAIQVFMENPYLTWEQFYNQYINNPCERIRSKFTEAKFKEKVTAIDKSEVFNYDHEMGYASAYPVNTSVTGTQYQPMENSIGTHNVVLPDGNQYFGYIHSHNNESDGGIPIKIFSPADVITFLTSCVRNADEHGSISDAYCMVITSEGNYILQYTGLGSFSVGPNQVKNWKSWYRDKFQELADNDNLTQPNVEKLFARFLSESVKINGLDVYYVEKGTGKASKLNTDGTKTPCP